MSKDSNGAEISTTDTYHVHKCILGAGSRKSGYFVKLFSDGGRFAENQENKSRINLHELAAKAFPEFLDYLYCVDPNPTFTTDTATALHYLAKYFDMPHLRWNVRQFWKDDVRDEKACGTYYEHALILQETKIARAAVRACKENMLFIEPTSRFVHVADADFWIQMLTSPPPDPYGRRGHSSRHLSTMVAAFCSNVPVDKETFEKLADKGMLPFLSGEAVLLLLDAERTIIAPDDSELMPLQERCITAFACDWEMTDGRI